MESHKCFSGLSFQTEAGGELRCSEVWDGLNCWPGAVAGETLRRPCSEVMTSVGKEFDLKRLTGHALRICAGNGTWLWGNYTDYTECVHSLRTIFSAGESQVQTKFLRSVTQRLLFTGSLVSLACLLLSIFIYKSFRHLWSNRVKLIVNIMVSLVLKCIIWILIVVPSIFPNIHDYGSVGWICKSMIVMHFYSILASICCRVVQGHFLNLKLTSDVFRVRFPFRTYMVFSWVFPILVTAVWTILTAYSSEEKCWEDYDTSAILWVVAIPSGLLLMVNVLFAIRILQVILTKLQKTRTAKFSEKIGITAKAIGVLFPLLGFQNFLYFYNPGGDIEEYFMVTYAVMELSEGILASIFCCFVSQDVHGAIRNRCNRFLVQHSTLNSYSKACSFSPRNLFLSRWMVSETSSDDRTKASEVFFVKTTEIVVIRPSEPTMAQKIVFTSTGKCTLNLV